MTVLTGSGQKINQPLNVLDQYLSTHFFYRLLDFPSEPGVAHETLENEAKSRLAVA